VSRRTAMALASVLALAAAGVFTAPAVAATPSEGARAAAAAASPKGHLRCAAAHFTPGKEHCWTVHAQAKPAAVPPSKPVAAGARP
jgi:hypothetical protein